MTRIISFANHKGGVGKTTSTAAVGSCLAEAGYKTLLIDLDGQQNLTSHYLGEDDERLSVFDSLVKGVALPVVPVKDNLSLVPSSLEMAGAEISMVNMIAREQVLRSLLEPVKGQYDYILLDCPPSLGIITTNAVLASTDILVPMTPELLPLKGMRMLDDFISSLKRVKPDVQISGIFLTRYNNRKLNRAVDEAIAQFYSGVAFETRIRENTTVAESAGAGGSVIDYDPTSNGAQDYRKLTTEILQRLK